MEATGGPWSGTGLDPLGERVLEHLVGVPSADAAEVARVVAVPVAQAEAALRQLAEASLVLRVQDRPARWAAAPPRFSLGAALARGRAELTRAESLVERLHEVYEGVSAPRTAHLVESLAGGLEVAARYGQLLEATSAEVLHLAKPPYVTVPDVPGKQPAVAPGVRMRSVYDTEGFTDAQSLSTALRGVAQGGRLRLADRLPVKLVVFDRKAALLPVLGDRPANGSLVVHSPALVQALAALFESVWERAAPLAPDGRAGLSAAEGGAPPPPDRRTREILHLMAGGMKDETIARLLHVSRRTVQKHVSEAGAALGARTRFQIALLARDRGWLDAPSPAEEAGAGR
ncbi:regulatory protein, luxR family [Actinacidiphila yanglinensis]|uniref:Regulatory protein, luxR family n=1 Tax=Actinacidiphila yanglinensis TaxID=310779 RepID=A0A1H6E4F4_9ACTN|nr:LuxR C-terminal-related transcriptional regulator [Actinacidiphila yanglinensis]SEG92149.1 regulatory protein, luxR family [Actinacidiphila yanglinensis]